jgi:Holliday junction resolvasome RuvABC endonuclease subunit
MFLGLDLSLTGTGFCLIDSDAKIILLEKIHVDSIDDLRLFLLEKIFLSHLSKYQLEIKLVCIEAPAFGISEGHLFQIGEWNGVVKVDLVKAGLKWITAAPLAVKKFVSGTGKNVTKDLIMLDVYKNFGVEIRENNLADAYLLSRIAMDYYKFYMDFANKYEMKMKKHQIEVLEKINKSQGAKLEGNLI